MGWLDATASLASLGYNIYKDQHLTGSQREANAFSAAQAEQARKWQEDMYNQYYSPSAMMRQYADAGLNPALMYGGAGDGSMPSAGSPSSVSPSGADPFGNLVQLATLSEQIRGMRLDNNIKEPQAERAAEIVNNTILKGSAEIGKLNAEVGKIAEETKSEVTRRGLMAAQKMLAQAQKNTEEKHAALYNEQYLYEAWKREFRNEFGTSPDQALWNNVIGIVGEAARRIVRGGTQAYNWLSEKAPSIPFPFNRD